MIALSYGERGESGELWKEPGQTVENVKEIRHAEAERAAAALGADFRCLDLGDYPLEIDADALARIADAIREFAPDVLVTHTDRRPVQPRPPGRLRRRSTARGRSPPARASRARSRRSRRRQLFLFEPHQPELCNFTPTTFVDITRGDRAEARGDGRDEGAGVPADLLRPARRAARQPRAARLRPQRGPLRRGVPARASRRWWTSCERLGRARRRSARRPSTRPPGARGSSTRPRSRSSPARAPPGRRGPCAAARTTT